MLQLKQIYKEYKTGDLVQKALDGVDLNLRDNEFVAILGPSGSGKTTLLNIIGGLDRYDSGDLIINGISTKQYKDRDWDSYRNHTIGFVFQSYNLIPHQTLLANVEIALTISGVSKKERKERAKNALKQVGLLEQAHKKPNQLSGGQMQRVAIARSLVNDPDILLADEPTGALDSETSVQVMNLLKEVAKDRLVVMVTHNPELAEEYATRIVHLRDGKIRSDSAPFMVDEKDLKEPEHKTMGRSSMSFSTALSLSFHNLQTKKARTLLTSFAGSIGIIGIALILSLSTGVNTYIQSIEEETLSEYPLQIQSTGIDITSMMMGISEDNTVVSDDDIQVSQMITKMFSRIGSNDLVSFRQFLESGQSDIKKYVKAIDYKYNVVPQIFQADMEHIRQVNPDTSFRALGLGSANSSNSLMSMAMSTDVFYPLPSDTSLYEHQYDLKAGHWPASYKECILVLTPKGSMSDFLLYTLGLRDPNELDQMITQFSNEEAVTIPSDISAYSYTDILGRSFKLVNAVDYYVYDEEYKVYRDKSSDDAYMKKLVSEAEDLTIVGIVQPKEGAAATMLKQGIYYPSSLISHIMENAGSSSIVKAQIADPQINVFTGKRFDETDGKAADFDMTSLFDIDTDKLQSAFQIDESKLNMGDLQQTLGNVSLPPLDLNNVFGSLDIQITAQQTEVITAHLAEGYQEYIRQHPEADIRQLEAHFSAYLQTPQAMQIVQAKIAEIVLAGNDMDAVNQLLQALMAELMSGYGEYAAANGLPQLNDWSTYFLDYLNSPEARAIIAQDLGALMSESGLEKQLSAYMRTYMQSAMKPISEAMQAELMNMGSAMAGAVRFDADAFAQAIQFHMDEEDLSELLMTMMTKEVASYDGNLKKLGYADVDKPSEIAIYPKNFESKGYVLDILDNYNETMKTEDEEKIITYTDFVGTLMSSVTDIVNVISYVLVAFVAISLVVSSIMIGVITYISVLERKKEIGILRAVGASRHNISQVFNAETIIIGLGAGLMGIGITVLLLIPGNHIIHSIAGQTNINAILPVPAGCILVLLSMVLTLIGGILPSRKAAKEDPVSALRNE